LLHHLLKISLMSAPEARGWPLVAIESSCGNYQPAAELRDGALEFTRCLEMRASRLPVAQYEAYRKFINDVVKADHAQIVLVRKTN